MSDIQLIVGLGNPGPEYQHTRHNAGAWFLNHLASSYNCTLKLDTKFYGYTGKRSAHPQVKQVHDLHIWSITSGLNALSCHVMVDGDMRISDASVLIANLEQGLLALGIHHATIQVESLSHPQTSAHSDALVCDISEQQSSANNHIGHSH